MTRYSILSEIGRGSMGIVYEALQVSLKRRVALKVLHATPKGAELARFHREIEVLSDLAHPNVVRFYDDGEQDGRPFFSMALVEGDNLKEVLQGTPLSLERATALVADVADALAYLHANGVCHRDVKPANLILTPENRVLLVDFGLARSIDVPAVTASGTVVGTILYLAPECLMGDDRGMPRDVYALALSFHELVTGKSCYASCDLFEVCARKLNEPPPSLEYELSSVPAWLLELQDRALAPDPATRISAAEYRDGLRRRPGSMPRGAQAR